MNANVRHKRNRAMWGEHLAESMEQIVGEKERQVKRNSRRNGGEHDFIYIDTTEDDLRPIYANPDTNPDREAVEFVNESDRLLMPNVRVAEETVFIPAGFTSNSQGNFQLPVPNQNS